MRWSVFTALIFTSSLLLGQVIDSTYLATVQETPQADGSLQFGATLPEQQQMAGAPPAFYKYHWEFGDGHFSREATPQHHFRTDGEYQVQLYATGGYDNGRPPTSRPKGVQSPAAYAGLEELPTVLDAEQTSIRIQEIRDPRPEEEIVLILSYKNPTTQNISGELSLFYNETTYPDEHFEFKEGRTHFGEELQAPAYSLLANSFSPAFTQFSNEIYLPNPAQFNLQTSTIPQEIIDKYQDKQAWQTGYMIPGETRNLFISLDATAEMLQDTHATIYLQAYFQPDQPNVSGFGHELALEIVTSHDPNHISVRNGRLDYRFASRRPQEYKIRFQNNGEGPAAKVRILTTIDDELDYNSLEILGNYPECPLCPPEGGESVTYSCMDTIRRAGEIEFIFRNIYLPGSNQPDINDRDSTKGYVSYRIAPERRLPKQRSRNRAAIYFDRNPPVYTNSSGARFKPGISPGIYLGRRYSRPPGDAESANGTSIGVVLAPYSAYKPYLQLEGYLNLSITTSFSQAVGGQNFSNTVFVPDQPTVNFGANIRTDSILSDYSRTTTMSSNSLGIVPLQVRYALNTFVGVGVGTYFEYLRDRITTSGTQTQQLLITRTPGFIGPNGEFIQEGDPSTTTTTLDPVSFSESRTTSCGQGYLFFDLQLGRVRTWPVIGFRYNQRVIGDGDNFYSVYLGGKF